MQTLHNKHKGEPIYIVGGGKSIDYYPTSFWNNKIVIGVNQATRKVNCNYSVRKEGKTEQGVISIMSYYRMGDPGHARNEADYIFNHNVNRGDSSPIDIRQCHPGGDRIIVGGSTITSAMHIAAFMGASEIYLAGHDLCSIDGAVNSNNYYDGVLSMWDGGAGYRRWLDRVASQSRLVADYIKKEYDTNIVSLSPFMGLLGEGHKLC